MEKKTTIKKIILMCDMLPECCSAFLIETGTQMAPTTRLAYANELSWFFDYLISYSPVFCDIKKKEIQLEQIKKIESQDISRYLTLYMDDNHKERTVARKRAALSSFFNYMTANRKIEYNPVLAATKVKIHQSDEVIHLDMEEQERLLTTIKYGSGLDKNKMKYHNKYAKRDSALILLLLDTGMRVSEVHGIDIADVDFDRCSVIVTRKGGNHQNIYFSNTARDYLVDYIEEKKINIEKFDIHEPLFTTLKGNRLSIRAIEVLVKKYTAAALPGKADVIHAHSMRSSFAMSFYEASGKDLLALQRKLGHKNLAATNIYAKATDKDMENKRALLRP